MAEKVKAKDRFKPGDLVEINRPFPVGECVEGKEYKVREVVGDEHLYVEGSSILYHSSYFNLVTRPAPPSPIRTRHEIVPGVYGPIEISGMHENGGIYLRVVGNTYKADDIREIIHIASQVLEFLEENAG